MFTAKRRMAQAARVALGLTPPIAVGEDPRVAELQERNALLEMAIEQMGQATLAARHLLDVLTQMQSEGPVFKVDEETHEPTDVLTLQHALHDLWACLEGAPRPEFATPQETH